MKKKAKFLEMEAERLKQEVQRAQDANSSTDNKVFAAQLEAQKVKQQYEKTLQDEKLKWEEEKEDVQCYFHIYKIDGIQIAQNGFEIATFARGF